MYMLYYVRNKKCMNIEENQTLKKSNSIWNQINKCDFLYIKYSMDSGIRVCFPAIIFRKNRLCKQ